MLSFEEHAVDACLFSIGIIDVIFFTDLGVVIQSLNLL